MRLKDKIFRLSPAEKENVIDICQKRLATEDDILFAFVYGSFIEPANDPAFHDIDIGIYTRDLEKEQALFYSLELAEQLSIKLKMPVDIRLLNSAPVTFCFHVIKGRLLVNNDDDLRSQFMERVIAKYLDMKPLLIRSIKEAYAE